MKPSRLSTAIAASVVVLATLSGCTAASTGSTPAASPSVSASELSAVNDPDLSAAPPAALTLARYHDTFTDSDGYKVNVSVTVSPVMLGTDPDALASAWKAVGGTGDVPCSSGTPENEAPNYTIQPDSTGFAFGTVQLTNGSPGFTPKHQTFLLHGLGGAGAAGFGFGNGAQCKSLVDGFNFTPNWTSDTWGPVPIVIAVYNYRSPAHPDGDPSKLAEGMYFGVHDFSFPLTPAS